MSINRKFMLSISALIGVLAAIVIGFAIQTGIEQVNQNAAQEKQEAVLDTTRLLNTTNDIMLKRVDSSMKLLKKRSLELGYPSLGAEQTLSGRQIPALYFGNNTQFEQFGLVDGLTEIMGGTATLFARAGDDYVRISTNVVKDGKRAIGTLLSPTGKAMQAIKNGNSYYGMVDILGKPYIAAYEPIIADSRTIGIWYVGYPADMSIISDSVTQARILQQGFVALYDGTGELRIHSDNVNESIVKSAMTKPDEWVITRTPYSPWRYEIVTAYPKAEVTAMIKDVSLKSIGFVLVAGLIVIAFIAWLIHRIVGKPLASYVRAIKDLADGEGDFTKRFEQRSSDELGIMASGFNRLLNRVHESIKQSKIAAQQVNQSADQLMTLAAQSLSASESQNKDTEQVAAASHEMSISAQDIAKNTDDAEQHANQANSEVRRVGDTINKTIQSIQHQSETIQNSSAVVQELVDASHSISNVLSVINDIADQTNLLALNAAIEAARAGEQGRGFAVVADEVRLLASRTQKSTEEIHDMVERLQRSGRQASEQMSLSSKIAEENVQQAQVADEVLRTVLESMDNISRLNAEIASAVNQQRYVAEDVSKNINMIREASDDNLRFNSETQNACRQLRQLADDLHRQLDHYKV